MALHLNKFGPPLSNNAMRKVWLVVAPWFVRRRRKCEKLKGRRGQRTNFELKIYVYSMAIIDTHPPLPSLRRGHNRHNENKFSLQCISLDNGTLFE